MPVLLGPAIAVIILGMEVTTYFFFGKWKKMRGNFSISENVVCGCFLEKKTPINLPAGSSFVDL